MAESLTIDKKDRPDNDIHFAALKQDGIKYIQQLSGKNWTDYNVHDPGVTILEQLCYALTDLVYRSDFGVEDHLADEKGRIDCVRQALYPPEKILPSRPTTISDYRKVIFDAVHELDNVWLIPLQDPDRNGLYRVMLRIKEEVAEENVKDVVEKVRMAYGRNRNLCEDIGDIIIVKDVICELHAQIEIHDVDAAADILARIYYEAAKHITAGMRFHPYENLLRSGVSLDEILKGPFCRHGYIKENELGDVTQDILITDLFSIIKAVEGVDRIKSLYVEQDGKIYDSSLRSPGPDTALRLHIPNNGENINISVFKNGRLVPVPIKEFRARYDEINFSRQTRIHSLEDASSLYPPPHGQYRDLRAYSSMQNDFPAIYGINRYGVPTSGSLENKARSRQLKAYLVLFEQLLVNHGASLHELRDLFSTEIGSIHTYAYEVLRSEQIGDLDAVYAGDAIALIDGVLKKYDNYADRKGRLLDYLLALYGESFSQQAITHFNYYYTSSELAKEIIRNKAEFLIEILEFGKEKAAAFNYHHFPGKQSNMAGLQRKLSIILGFKRRKNISLTMGLVRRGLKLIPDEESKQLNEVNLNSRFTAMDDIDKYIIKNFESVSPTEKKGKVDYKKTRKYLCNIPFFKNNVVNESLFTDGIYLDTYKVGKLTSDEGYQLVFQPRQSDDWWYLGTYPDRSNAVDAANALQRFLINLNIESEGLYLIEHILLRPDPKKNHDDLNLKNDENFYSFRFSVVFPSWSARGQNHGFRFLAEEMIRKECPAHLCPDIYWLNFFEFTHFEHLYRQWLQLKIGHRRNAGGLDMASKKLIQFLLDHRVTR